MGPLLTLGAMTLTLSAYNDKHSLSSRGRDREKTWERGENLGCTMPEFVAGGASTPPSELDSSSSSRSCCGVHAITRGLAGPAWGNGFLLSGTGASEESSWMPPGLASPEIPESPDLSWLLRGACCCKTLNVKYELYLCVQSPRYESIYIVLEETVSAFLVLISLCMEMFRFIPSYVYHNESYTLIIHDFVHMYMSLLILVSVLLIPVLRRLVWKWIQRKLSIC
jgi:hypothetical protein